MKVLSVCRVSSKPQIEGSGWQRQEAANAETAAHFRLNVVEVVHLCLTRFGLHVCLPLKQVLERCDVQGILAEEPTRFPLTRELVEVLRSYGIQYVFYRSVPEFLFIDLHQYELASFPTVHECNTLGRKRNG